MKLYTLTPPKGEPIIDVLDDVETNGKLVFPMLEGDYHLNVKTISADDARNFRKERDRAAAHPAPVVAETLPAALLPPVDYTEEQIEDAAEAAHEANRVYCESIGDHSQVPWDEAPQWQRDSAINGVKFAIAKNFPGGEAMHINWMQEKVTAGWVWGEKKDADLKTHPNIMPYAELPEEQRRKDDIFRDTVIASLAKVPTPVPAAEAGTKKPEAEAQPQA